MPDVKGMSASSAYTSLEARGLQVRKSVVPNSSGASVVSQDPSPGTTVSAGDPVTIYVA
jgi:beta-lactam-binding protein with PASTA domain